MSSWILCLNSLPPELVRSAESAAKTFFLPVAVAVAVEVAAAA